MATKNFTSFVYISYDHVRDYDSSVGIATFYGLEGPGVESRLEWARFFRTRPDRPWGPHILLYKGYRIFPGGNAAGAWRWPPTPSSAGVKESVEPYLSSPTGPSWPVLGWTFTLFYLYDHVTVLHHPDWLVWRSVGSLEHKTTDNSLPCNVWFYFP
jgi:hypothetical protein